MSTQWPTGRWRWFLVGLSSGSRLLQKLPTRSLFVCFDFASATERHSFVGTLHKRHNRSLCCCHSRPRPLSDIICGSTPQQASAVEMETSQKCTSTPERCEPNARSPPLSLPLFSLGWCEGIRKTRPPSGYHEGFFLFFFDFFRLHFHSTGSQLYNGEIMRWNVKGFQAPRPRTVQSFGGVSV